MMSCSFETLEYNTIFRAVANEINLKKYISELISNYAFQIKL